MNTKALGIRDNGKIRSRRYGILILYVLAILFSTYPFVFNLILPLPSITILMIVNLAVYVLLTASGSVRTLKDLIPICIAQMVATVLSLLATSDTEYFKQLLYIFSGLTLVSIVKTVGLRRFLFCYNRIILVVAVLGTLSSILTILFGERILMEYVNMDGRPGWFVYFTFTNSINGGIIRYSGIFDEPGAIAFWGMFSLVFNKIYVKDKMIEIPLIICLLFTFSIAFIIQVAMYLVFFYVFEAKFHTKLIVILLTILAVGFVFFNIDKDSPIYMLTFGRLGIGTSYNILEDSSRANLMLIAKQTFEAHPWLGVGSTAFYGGTYMADNPYETLAKDGIIGTIFLYLPLICTFYIGLRKKEVLFSSLLLSVGYLQRPFHINFLHYTMLYLFFFVALQIYKEETRQRLCVK